MDRLREYRREGAVCPLEAVASSAPHCSSSSIFSLGSSFGLKRSEGGMNVPHLGHILRGWWQVWCEQLKLHDGLEGFMGKQIADRREINLSRQFCRCHKCFVNKEMVSIYMSESPPDLHQQLEACSYGRTEIYSRCCRCACTERVFLQWNMQDRHVSLSFCQWATRQTKGDGHGHSRRICTYSIV